MVQKKLFPSRSDLWRHLKHLSTNQVFFHVAFVDIQGIIHELKIKKESGEKIIQFSNKNANLEKRLNDFQDRNLAILLVVAEFHNFNMTTTELAHLVFSPPPQIHHEK